MTGPLWIPSADRIARAPMTAFMVSMGYASYKDLYQFSIDNPEAFWTAIWDFCAVIGERGARTLINGDSIEDARFFPDAQLNYSENLLRRRDEAIAIYFYGEQGQRQHITFKQLHEQTASVAAALKSWGVSKGDRVAGYLPNLPQTVIAMLATASLGAVWSSCSPDFGIQGVIDRFGQIAPKVLFIADGYSYGGKEISCVDRISALRQAIPSLSHVVGIPYRNNVFPEKVIQWESLLGIESELSFTKVEFSHPLFIMYSSGTTGIPKCIVHGMGGTLLQHLKEHQLHSDIRPDDRIFYFTTCGWMMWNWLVSALASNASLVLYDGSPVYPKPDILFDIADEVGITLFGTSAKYIDSLSKLGVEPIQTHRLDKLRTIASTGSPLAPESFDYVYTSIKHDVCLSSISGGTDIISCFALGNPTTPVWRGELQTRGLGIKVDVYSEDGKPMRGQQGELVCTAPFPSQPIGFWNDPDGQKYHNAYFSRFPNVWHHGDLVELTSNDGLIIYGRSDATLNPGGVRIGTAEIYRQVDLIPEVLESIAVGQQQNGDVRVVLFVHLRNDLILDESLIARIKSQIRTNATPRHVPEVILQVPDIPKTKNGKLAEIAVRQVIHGEEVKNKEALANPEALDNFVV